MPKSSAALGFGFELLNSGEPSCYIYISSFYLKILIFRSIISGISKCTLKYNLFEINFDFES